MIPFKIHTPNQDPAKIKVGDTDFKKHYPALNRNTAWDTILPYINQAAEDYIIPFIGLEQYNAFCTKIQADNNDRATNLFQTATAYYTIFHALPFLNTTIGDLGVMQNDGTDTQTMAANQWRYANTQWSAVLKADKTLDQLLTILFDDPAYTDFHESAAKKFKKSDFFKHPVQLSDHVNIQDSFRTFNALTPFLKKAEQRHLLPIICQEQYNALLTTYAPENKALYTRLYELAQAMVAEYATIQATRKLHLLVRDTGFVIVSHSDNFTNRKNATETKLAAIEAVRQESITNAANCESDLIQFLYDNKENLPLWANSKCAPSDTDCGIISSQYGAIML